jgi:hypothetical protein
VFPNHESFPIDEPTISPVASELQLVLPLWPVQAGA